MIKQIALVGAFALSLSACSGNPNPIATTVIPKVASAASDVTKYVQQDVLAVAKTSLPDLQRAMDVASTLITKADGTQGKADEHGAQCYAGLVTLNKNANAILAAAAADSTATSGSGIVTQAEVLSIYAPESPAFQDAKSLIVQACFAKMQDVQTAINVIASPASLLANLSMVAPVIAPAAALAP